MAELHFLFEWLRFSERMINVSIGDNIKSMEYRLRRRRAVLKVLLDKQLETFNRE
jgi:hypothetical protein